MKYALFDTAIGTCAIAWTERGISALKLPGKTPKATATAIARSARNGELAEEAKPSAAIQRVIKAIVRHLEGRAAPLDELALDWAGVPAFQRRVYEAARAVPPGTTVSYGELATRIDSPGAARAVGSALGKNPFPIVVPCHRVLAAGGKPGGFSAEGGLATKAKILAIEGFQLEKPARRSLLAGKAALPFDAEEARKHLAAKDKKLARLMERAGPFRLNLQNTQSTFDALAESIVFQQLNGKAAATIFGRVKALFPKNGFHPAAIADMEDDPLRGAGLSRNKLLSLRDLAAKTLDGTVPPIAKLRKMADDDIVEHLSSVRGIGRWTAEMLLIFRLGRPDVLPTLDYGVRNGFSRTYGGELPAPKALEEYGERWRPFRTVASWYMWRATEL